MPVVTDVGDLKALARRRLPKWVFDYAEGGSYAERTLRANQADLAELQLRQRVMVNVDKRSQATTVLGSPIAMPLALAPTGLAGFFHPNGEIHAARAAEEAGIPFCLSTVSICSIEEVRAATRSPFWFQVYIMRDRGFTRSLIERAAAAGCSTLVLTVDLQLQAQRHRDIRNGLTVPPRLTLTNILEMLRKPRWALGIARAGRFDFGNLRGAVKGGGTMTSFAQWVAGSFDPTLNWDDVAWVRNLWPGKLVVKGILDAEDARLAAAAGADAVVVSNHGGRQLDGAPSSISVLPDIADAVEGQVEILFDGGISSGQDVLKALALGARCCLMGRSYLYGLAAMGQCGVAKAIDLIGRELDVSLALTGCTDVRAVDSSILHRRAAQRDFSNRTHFLSPLGQSGQSLIQNL